MALGLNISKYEFLTFGHHWELGFCLSVLSVALFVSAFFIGVEEAAEGDDGAAGGELHSISGCRGCLYGDGCGLTLGICHLGSNSALPNQVIELPLVATENILKFCGSLEGFTSRANSFVSFLSVLALARILTGSICNLVCSIERGGLSTSCRNRLSREGRRVSTHIGDVTVFVQALSHAHGLLRGELQLARSFLLQGRSGEGCGRTTSVGLGLETCHDDLGACFTQCCGERSCCFFAEQRGLGGQLTVVIKVFTRSNSVAADTNEFGFELRGRLC